MKRLLLAFVLFVSVYSTKITSGVHTIGSDGEYATLKELVDSLGAGFTGNLTARYISPVTEAVAVVIGTYLQGYTFTIESDSLHYGDYNRGHLITYNGNTNFTGFINIQMVSDLFASRVIIKNLNIKMGAGGSNWNAAIRYISASKLSCSIENVIVNLNAQRSYGFVIGNNNSASANIYNCMVIQGKATSAVVTGGVAILSSGLVIIENSTFFGCNNAASSGIWNYYNSANVYLRNVLCLGNTKDFAYNSTITSGMGNSRSIACGSSDATGNFGSLTTLNEVLDTAALSANIMKLKYTGTAARNGVKPLIIENTKGILGNNRPSANNVYSIGFDNAVDSTTALQHITSFPKKNQVYQQTSKKATVTVAGKSDSADVAIYVKRNGAHYDSTHTSGVFSWSKIIPSELASYNFILKYGADTVGNADSVVAGNIYAVAGQSNSISNGLIDTITNQWIRSLGTNDTSALTCIIDTTWGRARADSVYKSRYVSTWPMVMARNFIVTDSIPVGLFCGGVGATPITMHKYSTNLVDISARLLYRFRQANVSSIRGYFWWQGESEPDDDSALYVTRFTDMYNQFKMDIPQKDSLTVFVIGSSCAITKPNVVKALRSINKIYSTLTIEADAIPGTAGDGCHHTLAGYYNVGDTVYGLMDKTNPIDNIIIRQYAAAKRLLLLRVFDKD